MLDEVLGIVFHLLFEHVFHATGRRVLRVVSFGRLRIPALAEQGDRPVRAMMANVAATIVGILTWIAAFVAIIAAFYFAYA